VGDKTSTTTQGTTTQGWDATGASTVSYITSFLPGDATPTRKTEAQLNKELYDMTPAERISYATKLKAAGYRVGPINGAVTKNLRQSWLDAHSDLGVEIQAGQALDLTTFLSANAGTGTGSSGPKTTSQTYVTSPSQTAKLVNTVAQDLLGRDLTKAEQAKYLKLVNAQQKAEPTMTTSGSGFSNTRGGVDTEQIVTEQIAQTGEARTKRATDAYSIMLQELGGLQ
jgi:hypothetical protein